MKFYRRDKKLNHIDISRRTTMIFILQMQNAKLVNIV